MQIVSSGENLHEMYPLLIVSQLVSMIQIVDINSHPEWQTVQIFRSQLIWIYTVCKGGAYLGSAGQWLKFSLGFNLIHVMVFCFVFFSQIYRDGLREQ